MLAFVESGGASKQAAGDKPEQQPKADSQQPQQQQAQSQAAPPADQKAQSDRQLEASKSKPAREAQQQGSAAGQQGRRGRGVRYTDIPNSQIRKIIAQRLLESKQTIPSLYVTATADIDAVTELRQQLKDQGKKVRQLLQLESVEECEDSEAHTLLHQAVTMTYY